MKFPSPPAPLPVQGSLQSLKRVPKNGFLNCADPLSYPWASEDPARDRISEEGVYGATKPCGPDSRGQKLAPRPPLADVIYLFVAYTSVSPHLSL